MKVRIGDRSVILIEPSRPTGRVLLFFHGSRQSGSVLRRFTGGTFDQMAERTGTTLIYPNGVRNHFNDARLHLGEATRELGTDDVAFTREILEHVNADPEHVYAAGFSNGGHMVVRLLHEAPGLLTGAALFSSGIPAPDNWVDGPHGPLGPASPGDLPPTPILIVHGTGDPIVPYGGGIAGLDREHARGQVLSAPAAAEYFARLNGVSLGDAFLGDAFPGDAALDSPLSGVSVKDYGESVRLITVERMGHVVPAPGVKIPVSLGKATSAVNGAEEVARFFDWEPTV